VNQNVWVIDTGFVQGIHLSCNLAVLIIKQSSTKQNASGNPAEKMQYPDRTDLLVSPSGLQITVNWEGTRFANNKMQTERQQFVPFLLLSPSQALSFGLRFPQLEKGALGGAST
jgi:hypothetical protein